MAILQAAVQPVTIYGQVLMCLLLWPDGMLQATSDVVWHGAVSA